MARRGRRNPRERSYRRAEDVRFLPSRRLPRLLVSPSVVRDDDLLSFPAEPVFRQPERLPAKRVVSPRGVLVGESLRDLQFANPLKAVVCVSRKIRREVLFAFRGAGAGAKRHKRHYRRSATSEMGC